MDVCLGAVSIMEDTTRERRPDFYLSLPRLMATVSFSGQNDVEKA